METSVNNKCKAFTSLEQSKKLAKILPLESADMYYFDDNRGEPNFKVRNGITYYDSEDCLCCWSLAALLDVLPIIDLYTPTLKMKLNHKYYMELCIDLMNHKYITTNDYDSPVDACVAMIEKLKELNLL